jgi:superfamily II DNA/RNA helicase
LPIIEKIKSKGYENRRGGNSGLPVVLILEPTRELAIQVSQELTLLAKPHKLRVLSVFGGSSYYHQEQSLVEGVHIVVATPGRLLDHINGGTIDLSHIEHVVLDEGDTMLEMGFQKDVESILLNVKSPGEKARATAAAALSPTRDRRSPSLLSDVDIDRELEDSTSTVQLLLFSATMPAWICSLTDKLMREPVFLDAVQEGETRLADTITHFSLPVRQSSGKSSSIGALLEDVIFTLGGTDGQTIVFTNTKDEADTLVNSDCFGRLKAQVLHGDISQSGRQVCTMIGLFVYLTNMTLTLDYSKTIQGWWY